MIVSMTRLVKRAYKFRFYPDAEQEALLARTFGCTRFVYNRALAARTAAWKDEHRRISYVETSALLTEWKRDPDLDWLNEVSSVPLQQALRHLNTAFMNFWDKRAAYPTFKAKRRSRDSAEFTYRAFSYTRDPAGDPVLKLAKTTRPLDVVWHRAVPADTTPSTVTVTRDPAGRWFASLLFDAPVDPMPAPAGASPGRVAGVDMGQVDTITVSTEHTDGTIATAKTPGLMPRQTLEDKLARAQRRMARTQKGSKNRAKAARTVARLHAKIADRRRDHLHKTSYRLVRDNQAIGLEDLDVRGMTRTGRGTVENPGTNVARTAARNRRNLGVGYRELRTMIEYKADWHDVDIVHVDRFYPSTRMCSTNGCGHITGPIPTKVRSWTCPHCHTLHDRDINAATNIRAAATAVLACGDGVRLRGGQPSRRTHPADETGNLGPRGPKPDPSGPGS